MTKHSSAVFGGRVTVGIRAFKVEPDSYYSGVTTWLGNGTYVIHNKSLFTACKCLIVKGKSRVRQQLQYPKVVCNPFDFCSAPDRRHWQLFTNETFVLYWPECERVNT